MFYRNVVSNFSNDDFIKTTVNFGFKDTPNASNGPGKTALHLAAEAGEVSGVLQLLSPPPIPSCTPNQDNANALHHYVLQVRRPSAPLGEGTRTRVKFGGESFVFQGLSIFFHRELSKVLPKMPVSLWINEYEFHFKKAPMIDCFIVEELDFFHQYVFVDLSELYDEPLRAFSVHNGCPIYHVVPRFVSERGGCRQLLPMSEVIRYICDFFKPLVTDDEYERVENCTDAEFAKVLLSKKFQLATNPKKRPLTIRFDNIKRMNNGIGLGIGHKTSPRIAYANLKNPELVEAQRRLSKLRRRQRLDLKIGL
ncbi:unnamed protein product [Cylicocyclus nassatus]|uniref:Ribonuclease 3 central domain-containing protein n=1 Tax=Cylicocyclus nassatus TaxID=53992 RepID=A0AA36GVH9_CYLNA|nr:unnamed protein product [Cylicocyclus nassatus]